MLESLYFSLALLCIKMLKYACLFVNMQMFPGMFTMLILLVSHLVCKHLIVSTSNFMSIYYVEIFHNICKKVDLLVALEEKCGHNQSQEASSSGDQKYLSYNFMGVHLIIGTFFFTPVD